MVSAPVAARRRGGTLAKKLLRDMRGSAMQFFAMLMLCFMGTWCFSGMDANWRTMDRSFQTYFSQHNLADFWVRDASLSALDRARIGHVPGVGQTFARTRFTADCPKLGDGVTAEVIAFDGEMSINRPYIRSGSPLQAADQRGVLVEEQFAVAQGLAEGDKLVLDIGGAESVFTVRGTVLSPEYIVTSKDIAPTPESYGFLLINRSAVQHLPITEVTVTLRPGADRDAVHAQIERLLPGALILTPATNSGTATARNFVGMFRALSFLFPVLVYAVATMIVVSTLTRMIENQRIQLGTLKALGFPSRTIRRHYMAYAWVPSLAGSLIGLAAGRYTLPDAIWTMMMHNARMPYMMRADISPFSWAAFAGTVALSLAVCRIVYRRASAESAASLLRPKPPRGGTRILLERWRRLWARLSFNTKMVIRSIFRNRGRSFLSFVGVFCCNMLIICSLSLQDSIPALISGHYTRTLAYDVEAQLSPSGAGTLESYQTRLKAQAVEGVMERSVSAKGPLQTRACLLTVMPEGQRLIRLGKGGSALALPESGVCASRKLCRLLGLSAGDTITLYLAGDTEPLMLPIRGYAETSIGLGVYIGRRAWESCRKGAFAPTSLLLSGVSQSQLARLERMNEVEALKFPADQKAQTLSIMDSTTLMFSILSGAALLLAFIICYNMGLMNFTERIRDYATLKVLGYHRREIRTLMMREQAAIAVAATLCGIYPGMVLTSVILKMCEYDSMVFTAAFRALSIVKACLVSVGFSLLIQRFLAAKVNRIDMVEALKSVE